MAIDDRGSGAAQALQSSASVGGLNIERQNLTLRMSPRQWGITNSHVTGYRTLASARVR